MSPRKVKGTQGNVYCPDVKQTMKKQIFLQILYVSFIRFHHASSKLLPSFHLCFLRMSWSEFRDTDTVNLVAYFLTLSPL